MKETVLVLDVFVLVQKDLDHVGVLGPLAMFAVTEGDWRLGLGWGLLVGGWVGGEEGLGFAGRFGQLLSAVVQAPGVRAFFGAQHSKLSILILEKYGKKIMTIISPSIIPKLIIFYLPIIPGK